ncbi:MAG TPA: matrixin family metalloprotease, partial [Candidatus Acidoferrales bacterium]
MSWIFLVHVAAPTTGGAYVVNTIVADMRQPASQSGNTACPQPTRADLTIPGGVRRQWSTSLGASPANILTVDQTAAGRLNEIESAITQAFGVWTGVAGSKLVPGSLAPLSRTSSPTSCAADGVNSICFNQSDPAFATGVLAFTRVVTADLVGEQASASSSPASFVGQILDADILIRPEDSTVRFATPAALGANPTAYDLQSALTHEIGHTFGAGHSDVWRAVMFPFVPPAGTFLGSRPTPGSPDAPFAEDDRALVRALYPDPSDTAHAGSIAGRILPANSLVLSGTGATGIF